MAAFRAEPFVFMSWGLVLFGWILMLAAAASLQQVRRCPPILLYFLSILYMNI